MDLAYRQIDAGFTCGVVTAPAFLEMKPNGKVPVLIEGDGTSIFKAVAILRYLAAQRNVPLGHSGLACAACDCI